MFVAVRQGDSAVFKGACGEMGVIDANRFRTDEILAAMDQLGSRSLKWMAVTHYDADHLGDIVSVATSHGVTVGTFLTVAVTAPSKIPPRTEPITTMSQVSGNVPRSTSATPSHSARGSIR
jgi:beta-lactamase superfamily II metal-dependent hydrolase